jgi:hypothetical protein
MLAKCHICKCDIIVKTPQTKFCDNCNKIKKIKYDKEYKLEHKIHTVNKFRKCKVCFKEFEIIPAKYFCSAKCRNFSYYIPKKIIDRENTINSRIIELQELKERYAHLL